MILKVGYNKQIITQCLSDMACHVVKFPFFFGKSYINKAERVALLYCFHRSPAVSARFNKHFPNTQLVGSDGSHDTWRILRVSRMSHTYNLFKYLYIKCVD